MNPDQIFWHDFTITRRVQPLKVKGIWDLIAARYQKRLRAYHNMDHISSLLTLADLHQQLITHPVLFRLTILMHDLYYIPGGRENEEVSSLAFDIFGPALELSTEERLDGKRLVMATKHPELCADPQGQLLADFDLAGLALPWEEFFKNTERVRSEFMAVNYHDDTMRQQAIKFWHSMMERPAIYQREEFRDRWETDARRNITRLIKRLEINQSPEE